MDEEKLSTLLKVPQLMNREAGLTTRSRALKLPGYPAFVITIVQETSIERCHTYSDCDIRLVGHFCLHMDALSLTPLELVLRQMACPVFPIRLSGDVSFDGRTCGQTLVHKQRRESTASW